MGDARPNGTITGMASRQRTRRPQQGQLDLGPELRAPVGPAVDASDDDLQLLASTCSARTQLSFPDPDAAAWANSPYGWVKRLPTVSRGKAATAIVASLLAEAGVPVAGPAGPTHDLSVNARPARVKLSTRWGTGEYTFQQIKDGDYELLILLGLSPHRADLWVVPLPVALAHLEPPRRESSTATWLTFPASHPPGWLHAYGGNLDTAIQAALTSPGA